jgi:hypothetical protein
LSDSSLNGLVYVDVDVIGSGYKIVWQVTNEVGCLNLD